jgi:protein gp37
MKNTLIEWAHHTVNFWWGCVFARFKDGTVRDECIHCYAKMMAALFSRGKATWGADGNRWVRHEAARRELYKLDKAAHAAGVRERIFINSMSDTFEDRRDLDEARGFLWDACKFVTNLDILLLTKRPENITRMVPPDWLTNWPAHVWVGTTVGSQKAADENIPALLSVPAKIRFLSCEPMIGPVNLNEWLCSDTPWKPFPDLVSFTDKHGDEYFRRGIHWVICGGESGGSARPMDPMWVHQLRIQCASAGVAFFFKQWGEWAPGFSNVLKCVEVSGCFMSRTGKKVAGRHLDGKLYDEVPV